MSADQYAVESSTPRLHAAASSPCARDDVRMSDGVDRRARDRRAPGRGRGGRARRRRQRVVLVNQYRHPVGQRLDELPAGLLDVAGEPALTAAQRELAEEAGADRRRLARADRPAHLARHDRTRRSGSSSPAACRECPTTSASSPSTRRSTLTRRPGAARRRGAAGARRRAHQRGRGRRRARRRAAPRPRAGTALRPADAPWPARPGATDAVDHVRRLPSGAPRSRAGWRLRRRACRGYLDHLAVERGVAANTLSVLPPRPRIATCDYLAAARRRLDRRRRRRRRSARSSPTCARATTTIRRCRRRRPPARSSRCAGCTGSRCATGWWTSTWPARCARRRRRGGCRRRSASTTSSGCWTRPATTGTPLAIRDRALLELLYAHRRADLRGGRPGRRRPRPGRAHRAAAPARAASSVGCRSAPTPPRRVDAYLVQVRPALAAHGPRHAGAVPQLARRAAVAAVGVDGAAHGGRAGRAGAPGSRRTRCATRSPRI